MTYISVEKRLEIGEMIKYYRIQKGLTQKKLAKKSKKHISTIQRLESQTYIGGVSYNTVIDVSNALKIPLNRVLNNEYAGYRFII